MLSRVAILTLSLCTCIMAKSENVELLANEVKKDGDKIVAVGDVVVYSENYLITAQKAIYDEASGELELFENVNVIKGQSESSQSEYTKLNMQSEDGEYAPFFYYDQRSDIWLQCADATSSQKYFLTENSVVSSCNIQDPDWKIEFSEGKLNRETGYLHLWNSLFYVKGVPVFYTPYFGFSTDTTRRTGFLMPYFSYGSTEGFHYEQPFYYAPQDNWDLEFRPQIRTNRGEGIYTTLRYVDSPYSQGSLTVGYFNEKSSFVEKEKLRNKEHKGFEFEYTRSKLVSSYFGANFQDALWVDMTILNDVDYLNLATNNIDDYTGRYVTSRLNYFLTNDSQYFGTYIKYFEDLKAPNNSKTRQELPVLQYHKFTDTLLLDNITYSFDTMMRNYVIRDGVSATQYELSVPLKFSMPLFDDYLRFSFSENLYATYVDYDNGVKTWNEHFYKNYHQFALYTDLAKAYDNFFHTVNFRLEYTLPSSNHGQITQDFITTNTETKNISAKLVQFFYNADGRKFLRHYISQPYNLEKQYYKYGELENRIDLYITPQLAMANEFRYSHEFSKFTKVQSSIGYSDGRYALNAIHTYEDKGGNTTIKDQFITLSGSAEVIKNYSLFGSLDYDIDKKYSTSWQIGAKFTKKCWDYILAYRQKTELVQTSGGSNSRVTNAVMLMFNFYPIGGVAYEYEFKRKNNSENI